MAASDGLRIAFSSDRFERNHIYTVVPGSGDAPVKITSAGASSQESILPDWSPRGGLTYVFGASTVRGVHTINADGSNDKRLTLNPRDDTDPSFDPTGRYIVYAQQRLLPRADFDLAIFDTASQPPAPDDYRLLDQPSPPFSIENRPSWSPDGTRIAYASSAGGDAEIYVVRVKQSKGKIEKDGDPVQLTNNNAIDLDPAWSPDGSLLAFTSNRDGDRDIYRMSSTSGDTDLRRLTTNLAEDRNPSWSPDGATIAFTSERDGNKEIYTMSATAGDVDPAQLVRVTNDGGADDGAAWERPAIVIDDTTVSEGDEDTEAVLTVSLSRATTGTVSIDYATADDAATAPDDYTSSSGSIVFAPGETSRQLVVPVVGDTTTDNPDEAFLVRLTNLSSTGPITFGVARPEARVSILDDESCTAAPGPNPTKDDDDGDGLVDEIERGLGTDSGCADTDGDGLLDPWEVGTDVDGAGFDLDPTTPGAEATAAEVFGPTTPRGAPCPPVDEDGRFDQFLTFACLNHPPDPLRKDVYLELDWQDCRIAGCPEIPLFGFPGDIDPQHHAPSLPGLVSVIDAFAAAPATNPVGSPGVNLHILVDEAVPHIPNCDQSESSLRYDPNRPDNQNVRFGTQAQRAGANTTDVIRSRTMVYRYVWSGHSSAQDSLAGACPTPSLIDLFRQGIGNLPLVDFDWTRFGSANIGGNDILVTLGTLWACNSRSSPLILPQPMFRPVDTCFRKNLRTIETGIFPAVVPVDGKSKRVKLPVSALLGLSEVDAIQQLWGRTLMHLLGHSLGLPEEEVNNKPGMVSVVVPRSPLLPEKYTSTAVPNEADPPGVWAGLRFAPSGPGTPAPLEEFPNYDQLIDLDLDGDGIKAITDNCVDVANPIVAPSSSQADLDGDNYGDPCDNDIDGDGIGNFDDSTPGGQASGGRTATGATGLATGEAGTALDAFPYDTDNDGIDNDVDPDDDGDGVADLGDNCALGANPDQADIDADGIGVPCDADTDDDGTLDLIEDLTGSDPVMPGSTPEFVGPGSSCSDGVDNDGDATIDELDLGCVDSDLDTIPELIDLCPTVADAGFDLNRNSVGDACEAAPLANDVEVETSGGPVTIKLSASDTEGDQLLFRVRPGSGPNQGSLSTPTGDTVIYTPNPDFVGGDSFRFIASDGQEASNDATVTITLRRLNRPPVAVADAYETDEGVALTVAAPGVLGNDTDPDPGDTRTAELVAGPADATLALNADGSFTYTPNAGFAGSDTFTYQAKDTAGATSNVAGVTITVRRLNRPPVAVADAYETDEGVALTVPAPGVLGNDTDPDPGDTRTAELVAGPADAMLALNADGSFAYTPNAGFAGSDSFTYQAKDAAGATSNVATATITVRRVTGAKCPGFESDPRPQLRGTSGNDHLVGTKAGEIICGLGGDDQIDGRRGDDILVGGDGDDALRGGNGNDRLFGGAGRDHLYGQRGNDWLYGEEGADELYGDNGDDRLYGGAGDDLLSGGSGDDVAEGGDGNDHIHGDRGDDTLSGNAGDDDISGGSGDDRIDGGSGKDACSGDEGHNHLTSCEHGGGGG